MFKKRDESYKYTVFDLYFDFVEEKWKHWNKY